MEITDTDKRDLHDCIDRLRELLAKQTRLIDTAIHAIVTGDTSFPDDNQNVLLPKITKTILPLMIQGAGSSCHTILWLTSSADLPVRDCFPIARAIIETIINICYVLASGEEAAGRMERHALQKTYRDLNRTSSVSGTTINVRYTGSINPSKIPGLEEALQEFSTVKGDEKRLWTEDSIERRLKKISERFGVRIGTPLHTAQFAIYRHSSEILHGTYFGSIYFFGATRPGFERSGESARYTISNHAMLILFNLVMAIDAMIQALNAVTSISSLALASTTLVDAVKEIPLIKKSLAASKEAQE